MIAKLFHVACNKEIEKLKKTIEDDSIIILDLTKANHELRAIYDYRILELEQAIIAQKRAYADLEIVERSEFSIIEQEIPNL